MFKHVGPPLRMFKKYDAYKDSGVEWLGEVPNSWNVVELKRVVKEHSGNGFPIELQGNEEGKIPFLKVSDISGELKSIQQSSNYVTEKVRKRNKWNLVPKNSLVTGKIGEALRKNHRKILLEDSIIDNNCIGIEAIKIDYSFNYYLHKIIDFEWFVNPGTIPSISVSKYKNFKICLPSINEQYAIVNFLDQKTSEIDQAIAIKEQQIALLNERKQIVIQKAVTQGLNPHVAMKDSGVEWIGKIPEHWEIQKVKHLFQLIIEPAPKNNDLELLSVYTDIGVKPRKELEERGNKASTTDGYWKVRKGDIIVNKLLAWMGAIGLSNYDGVTSPAYDILRAIKPLNPYIYHLLFRSPTCSAELKKHSRGIMEMRLRLYFDKFGDVLVPYAPINEQNEIIQYIEIEEQRINSGIELIQQQIEKLKEYKTTLINDAVTGKIKVA